MKPYGQQEPKGSQIRLMFNRIAPHYDLLNRVLSLGVDSGWRRQTVRSLRNGNPTRILDVATGTGDLAIALGKAFPCATVQGVDISTEMIAIGRHKVRRQGLLDRITLVEGDASALDFADRRFDAVTAAFGVRNFEDLETGITQMYRVLDHGGRLAILEFSTPRNKVIAYLYRLYFHRILPLVGGWISGDRDAYRYLPSSVEEFPAPLQFMEILHKARFTNCCAKPLTGGIAYLYTAIK